MKKIILSAAVAAFALSMAPAHADSLSVKVTKTKIPEGCEYKNVPGKKQKQLVCIEEMQDGGGDGGGSISSGCEGAACGSGGGVGYNGNGNPNAPGLQDKQFRANNGAGNGTTDGIPGNSDNKDPAP